MKIFLPKLNTSAENLLRSCGYIQIQNPHTGESSFACSLNYGRFYPRFHVYIEKTAGQFTLNLHLDAKKPSYEGVSAHSGEYGGEIVEQEATRIQKISERMLSESPVTEKPIGFQTKKPWWKFWK